MQAILFCCRACYLTDLMNFCCNCVLTPSDSQARAVPLLPPAVQSLLDQFAHVFEDPVGLPPSRACDHEIPLIPGARPVNICPYRYTPRLCEMK